MNNNPHANWAQYYDFVYENTFGHYYEEFTMNNLEWITNNFPDPDRAKILDIGAGTGRLSIPLAERGYEVTALDPCREMLNELENKARQRKLRIDTVNKTISQFKEEREHFDLVICFFTTMNYILQVKDMKTSIRNMVNATKIGGKIFFDLATRNAFTSSILSGNNVKREIIITPQSGNKYLYEERTRGVMNGSNFSYEDSFYIRYWEPDKIREYFNEHSLTVNELNIEKHIWGHTPYLVIKE